MPQFQPYQHPHFQGVIFHNLAFPSPESDQSLLFHAAHWAWYKARPKSVSSPLFFPWVAATGPETWIGVHKNESEAASIIGIYGDNPPKPIVFYDQEAQLIKST